MNLEELKQKNPAELINEAEKFGIENPSTLRKQNFFCYIKKIGRKKRANYCYRCFRGASRWFGFSRAIELITT